MPSPDERLRPHPATRLTGPSEVLDLPAFARRLRSEPHAARDGHRQVGLIHRGPLRLVLFAFDAGGRLPEHKAPGQVVIECLSGSITVDAAGARHELGDRMMVVLEPGVPHAIEAQVESEMLLTVCLD